MAKTLQQLLAAKRAAKLLKQDPDYFAKLAARRKGTKNPNMARPVNKEASAKGGSNRGMGVKYKQRKQRSEELQRKLNEKPTHIAHKVKLAETRKKDKNLKKEIRDVWSEEDTTNLDEWV